MAYNPNKDLKMYYSIGEVAKMFDVNESLLRYWEKEFPIISPKRPEVISVSTGRKILRISDWFIIWSRKRG